MEEQAFDDRVDDFVCMEHAETNKRALTGGALYAVLLAAVIGVIMLANALSARWNWPRAAVQVTLYALLLALAWLVYRYRLLGFRYVLTRRMLRIDRVVGRKVRGDVCVRLSDVASIRPQAEAAQEGKLLARYTGPLRGTLAVCVCENGKRRTLYISPSEEFKERLIAQWKSLKP